ncbi:MAG: DUF6057 family protein, partial [Planctomycetota bacterium]
MPSNKLVPLFCAEYPAAVCESLREILYENKKVMPNLFRKLSSQNLGRPIRSLVFFILFYLYLWLEVNPQFIYHGGGTIANFPSFFRSWAFFQKFTSYPGGPVEYLTALLSQSFYISWAGALVITLQAWLICLCTDYFL